MERCPGSPSGIAAIAPTAIAKATASRGYCTGEPIFGPSPIGVLLLPRAIDRQKGVTVIRCYPVAIWGYTVVGKRVTLGR
jgi:hypothetical protein